MEKSALKELLATNLPLILVTAGGGRYKVGHPDFISIAPGKGTTVIVFREDGIGFSILDLTTITDVQTNHASA